ncbi:hypothetical protein SSX86_018132 [Deinandra increscens subsp. villosa]|uniref:Pectinesterase n=1 Tax=Deinandra increscens subsp. villosa TaxID=3103831 RepID=A0AAP0CVE1_9ASTR
MAMKVSFFFVCFLMSFIFSSSSSLTTTTGSIDWWCTQTPHYQTCNHHIAYSNISSTTISINQFLDMTVAAAINEARSVQKRAQGIYLDYEPNALGKNLWGSCVDYFDGIVFTLNMVLDPTEQARPLDVHTWLSAGLTYINVCEKGFEMINMTNTMLLSISTELRELLLNSLAISVAIQGGSYSNNSRGLHGWEFSNEYKLLNSRNFDPDVTVAKDGSGDFMTVQEAVDSTRKEREWGERYVIFVKRGVYEEQVYIAHDVNFVLMYGEGVNNTIISAAEHSGGDLKSSATFQVWGRGFMAVDMTFRNTAGPNGGQAVAFLSNSDESVIYHCSIEGYQDTLFSLHFKQFYKECQIFGTVDFIFGNGHSVFQDCQVFLRKPLPGGGLVVTAQGRQYQNESSGFSLQGCNITAGEDLKPVIDQFKKAFLGRPWFDYARTVFMESFLDDLVDPLGWEDGWGHKDTAYCGEYNNYGPGSTTDHRVDWPNYEAITDPDIAKQFTVVEFIVGDDWIPTTGVPYVPGFERS